MKQILIKRGDIFWVDFDPAKATEIQKTGPSLVLSHDVMNDNYTRVIVAPITSNIKKIYSFDHKLHDNPHVSGKVMLHQIRTVDKTFLNKKITSLSLKEMAEIEPIIKFILGV
ncbi:MAG: type II toxin-antitoxin system PemK/MazF family toxin [Candidatus Protochlamydia sp.]|nr:type II toxin-antitoxin system PemK/MazF family toxin [Candidatus Protochlamydia sp.]